MSEPAVKVAGLGKQYRLRERQASYKTLRETLTSAALAPARALLPRGARSARPPAEDMFWALKDVTFEVARGEVVGVVGRNGAGKSTLLKILSRITEPSEGYAEIRGRLGSLLEVGTGFHPELTGRENIYLNGAILGMRRPHINRRFDEIVAFAEVDKFIDLPVKHYSSGMYLRLAFGVAAHLEPDILIIDEVLAVGDAQFQKKCLGKIEEVGRHGISVLVVTHNMAVVTQLCSRAVWLSNGSVEAVGEADEVVAEYLLDGAEQSGHAVVPRTANDTSFAFLGLRALDKAGNTTGVFDVREPIFVEVEYEVLEPVADLELSVRVSNSLGVPIFTTDRSGSIRSDIQRGRHYSLLEIPALFLAPGNYAVDLGAHVPRVRVLQHLLSVLVFRVEETGSGMAGYAGQPTGVVLLDIDWHERRGQ